MTILHAKATRSLLHAAEPAGKRNILFSFQTLTDEFGEILVDQTGQALGAWGQTAVLVIHAAPTNSLVHAEDS